MNRNRSYATGAALGTLGGAVVSVLPRLIDKDIGGFLVPWWMTIVLAAAAALFAVMALFRPD